MKGGIEQLKRIVLLIALFMCKEDTKLYVGIDLGTTNSAVYVYSSAHNKPMPVEVDYRKTMPSAVRYDFFNEPNGTVKEMVTVGQKDFEVTDSMDLRNLVLSSKRIIGLSKKEIYMNPKLRELFNPTDNPYRLTALRPDDENSPMVINLYHNNERYKSVQPVEVSAAILTKLLSAVKEQIGTDIAITFVTVPAYFNENQVESTKQAAAIANLPLTRFLNEPVAAAYCYQMMKGDTHMSTTVVFDMGGGTLDISLVQYEGDVLQVLAYSGDNFLGGDDIDNSLFTYFKKEYESAVGTLDNKMELRLRRFAENFKIELCDMQNKSNTGKATLEKEFFYDFDKAHTFSLTSDQFENIIKDVIQRVEHCIMHPSDGIISKIQSSMPLSQVSNVLMVGGSSKLPAVRKMLGKYFSQKKINYELNADTCVAEGACWYAAAFAEKFDAPALVDVVSVPIGICVGENTFEPIIKMNATVPTHGSQTFTTSVNNQTRVVIKVGQGLRYAFSDVHYLGEFFLDIKNPAPKGVPKINVTIKLDKDRTLEVIAVDESTNETNSITFARSNYSLSPDEINRMRAEQEARKEDDEKLRIRLEAKNIYDYYLSSLPLRISKLNLPTNVRDEINERLEKEKIWLKNEKDDAQAVDFDAQYDNLKNYIEPLLQQYEKQPAQDDQKDYSQPTDQQKVREEL